MKKISLITFLAFALAACSGNDAKENLGLNFEAPDEFAVERKPKLDVPPSFKLRPPAADEKSLNAADTRDIVREKLVGNSAAPTTGDKSEDTFLKKIGTQNANDDIRDVLTREYPKTQDKGMVDRIRSLSDDNTDKTLVDANKEKQRIDDTKKQDQPINTGDTPTKSENDGKSIIDKVFN